MTEVDATTLSSQVRRAGYCTHPIRLRGRIDAVDLATGEMRPILKSADQPGGALLVSCRNRRATVCPACSDTYRGDAWQLIAAGLRGGKGVPAGVASHPRVFVTLTAPSFGPVHSRREVEGRARRCRPRRSGVCRHGNPSGCRSLHGARDPLIGQPLCDECFDYPSAVLWNAHAGALWNRTVIGARRALAKAACVKVRDFAYVARVAFVKVVEYQSRGVVHVHVVMRLDGPDGGSTPPPRALDVDVFGQAVRGAAASASVSFVLPSGAESQARWGSQLDVRPLATSTAGDRNAAVAGYIAKYATKSTDALGALDRRLRDAREIEQLAVNPHLRRLVAASWQLGDDPRYRPLRLRAWAHTLGYRGHWTTKSRRYSTTFTALRTARIDHAADRDRNRSEELFVGEWRYAGRGYGTWNR